MNNFYDVARKVELERQQLTSNPVPDFPAIRKFNDRLIQTERKFIYQWVSNQREGWKEEKEGEKRGEGREKE